MSQEHKNIVINNYFIIKGEDLQNLLNINGKEDGGLNKFLSIFQPIQKCHSIKTSFLGQKKQGPENKIIINEDQFTDINFNINNKTDKKDNKIEENLPSKSTLLSIEINNDKNDKNDSTSDSTPAKKAYFEINSKKKIGRKPKTSVAKSEHTKFSHDNILRKIKVKFLHKIINFMNRLIITKYSTKIHMLKHLKGKISQDNSISFNKMLLNSKLKDIFSNKISKKCKQFAPDHNKKLIEKIYNENIQIKTISILEKTLFECLEHFRGSKYYPELEGVEKQYECVIKDMESAGESNEYIDLFKDFLSRYEEYYKNKKSKPKNNLNKNLKK